MPIEATIISIISETVNLLFCVRELVVEVETAGARDVVLLEVSLLWTIFRLLDVFALLVLLLSVASESDDTLLGRTFISTAQTGDTKKIKIRRIVNG